MPTSKSDRDSRDCTGDLAYESRLLTNTVPDNGIKEINFREGNGNMANLRHPIDIASEDLAFLRSEIVDDFLEDDDVICQRERGILIRFDEAVARITRARGIERGIELLVKQEGQPTKYTHNMFADIGVKLEVVEPLDAA